MDLRAVFPSLLVQNKHGDINGSQQQIHHNSLLHSMSTERSPRFPGDSLANSLERLEKLYTEAKRSPVDSQTLATVIGYKAMSGHAKASIAALSYYGFIERDGQMYKVSDEGFSAARPLNDDKKRETLQAAAYRPSLLAEIRDKHGDVSIAILERTLLHGGFTEDGAKRAARVYKDNAAFLKSLGVNSGGTTENVVPEEPKSEDFTPLSGAPAANGAMGATVAATGKLLAQHVVPLGGNQAHVTFTGTMLMAEDFDALIEYLEFSKRQFARTSKPSAVIQPVVAQTNTEAAKSTEAPPKLAEVSGRNMVQESSASLFGEDDQI